MVIAKWLLALSFAVTSSALAADWPQYRGPDANGTAPDKGINKDWKAKTPRQLWRVDLGPGSGFGGPAVAKGVVYIIDHKSGNDILRTFDLQTGKPGWEFSYADQDKENWGFTRATPCINEGRVYTTSYLGKVHCLDAATGKLIWMRNLSEFGGQMPGWGYAVSPIIQGNTLLVCPGGKENLVALDKKTGKDLWWSGSDKAGYSTPVLATLNGKQQWLVFSGTSINSYPVKGGKPLWSYPWKTSYDVNASAPLVTDSGIFVSSGYGVGCAMLEVTAAGVKVCWQSKVIQQHFASGVVLDHLIYSTTDPGDLVCIDPATGAEKWRKGGFEKGGLVYVDGVLLVLAGNTGELVMVQVSPDKYIELGRLKPLGGKNSWTAPIVSDGKVIVRNNNALACLDLK